MIEEEGALTPVLSEQQEINISTPDSFDTVIELENINKKLLNKEKLTLLQTINSKYSTLPPNSQSVICKLYLLLWPLDQKITENQKKFLPVDTLFQIAGEVKNDAKNQFLAMSENDIIDLVWCLIEKGESDSYPGYEGIMGCYLLRFLFEEGKKDLIKKISCDKIKDGIWKNMRKRLQKSLDALSGPSQIKPYNGKVYFATESYQNLFEFIQNNRSYCKYGSFGSLVFRGKYQNEGGSKKRRRASRRKPVSKKRRIRRKVTKSRRR